MLLRDIKAGETYAFIPGYGELTRKDKPYCGNLPSAVAVQVVDKEKRLVEVRRDSCGRPKMQNQTFLVCKKINIAPTDILAADLDIVLEKHPELVEDTENISALDLIWPWETEIEQARTNAEVLRQVDNRVAYIEGVSFRLARALFNQDRPFYDIIKDKLNSREYERLTRVTLARSTQVAQLKQTVYDILKQDPAVVPAVDIQVHASCEMGNGYYVSPISYHWKRSACGKYAIELEYFRTLFPGLFAELDVVEKRIEKSTRGSSTLSYQERVTIREDRSKKVQAIWDAAKELSTKEKLEIVDHGIQMFAENAAKNAGIKIAMFNPKKNWVVWAKEAQDSAKEVHEGDSSSLS